MEHLNVDDIISFVSLPELNSKATELSATVNGHIRECEKCLKLVRAFQMIYDEFSMLNDRGDFRKYISENTSEADNENDNAVKLRYAPDEFDGFR